MVNFDLLAAEIRQVVRGIPGDLNGFCVLAALLHGTPVAGVSQTATLNRGRHLYSAGRPSRWALAHILVIYLSVVLIVICFIVHYCCSRYLCAYIFTCATLDSKDLPMFELARVQVS